MITTSSNEIRNMFDQIAPIYDDLNDWLSFGQHHIWKEMTVKWSGAKLGDTCLDLCCGSGDLVFKLTRHIGKKGLVYGVDFSAAQLAIAQKRSRKEYHASPINWIEGDALQLPLDNNTFDAITMAYGLRNVKDIPQCMKEVHRVLKPGKKAAILDFHRPQSNLAIGFQNWYLDNIVVPVGSWIGYQEEYTYIKSSLDCFPRGKEQVEIALKVGFTQATHYSIVNDMMGVLVVTKFR
ncbi:Ubiquinone/menaquinone biosynthesis methyltransferase UbiE [Richelia intracellularis HH01]|uniref:2-phytyl-1,4-naphtoquinone methyltransferase n=1 Tax=Richelia intracellularis HH01 TaxID=1165094 RepID=M1WQ33_9NOST|nr:bifunctional demethylmenaquinone methyltransferase/2-methoxy-6-polyprenyl-1,4-benzoquinol methylase UbiE [Richelia intracellularis]CCH66159.1 Ubiquinone/menaquinone biosynthesis methyltransferase UbiE [Richelia intracellularis HH01]HAE05961.1 bifunctional demethylmenaquinone methyltransferase/2-methoxy-6-polyprenyl-1,4-benzoquinol methylase UbiE [Richelia sp.]